ncbi:DUF924 family protein [Mesorhizobium sp. LHD-90]|uniref:DUF924 family protein n=1 Tax=Mesorhizobium sp. LHD-90 TaxID=3071414 RepID=UPI0027E12D24|nr:DUF924 family protein [Mesorhizobium sp. LHD-90]MDQ6437839.1 DUF924 family protein [Mesorhizobium sp. LHD-90]
MIATQREVVDFWRDAGQEKWFEKNDDFDTAFREKFLETHEAAARGDLDGWTESAEGALALLILLDQFPRNCFRSTAHMYATDPHARRIARKAVAAGYDRAFDGPVRVFFYLPFSHSEDLADQEEAVRLQSLIGEEYAKHARRHRDIVAKFSRFPHRNAILGRDTTPEEQKYLDDGGFAG